MTWNHPDTARQRAGGDGGLSLLVTVVSLLIGAVLVLLVVKATVGSGSGAPRSSPTPVSAADTAQAQQSLAGALATLQQTDPSGQGSLDAATLQAADPSLTFTSSPSTGPSTLSVTPAPDGTSVALADRSSDGTCWYLWWSPSSGAWYGAQTSQSSCTAPTPTGTPTPGPVSSTSIGWQQGSAPPA